MFTKRELTDENVSLTCFSRASKFKDKKGNHIENTKLTQYYGSPAFLSRNVIELQTPSRKDDIISLILCLVFMRSTYLQWYLLPGIILQRFRTCSNKEICRESPELLEILDYLDKVRFEDAPDYERIKFYLIKIIINEDQAPKSKKKVTMENCLD